MLKYLILFDLQKEMYRARMVLCLPLYTPPYDSGRVLWIPPHTIVAGYCGFMLVVCVSVCLSPQLGIYRVGIYWILYICFILSITIIKMRGLVRYFFY